MTTDERRKLAELCGFTFEETSAGTLIISELPASKSVWHPDESIEQAMMVEEAVGKLGDFVKVKYSSILHKNYGTSVFLFDLIHATADQRCRAALAAKDG